MPLRIWVITRQADAESRELPVTYLRFGDAPPAADLLLLPAVLPEVTRLVVLDVEESAEAWSTSFGWPASTSTDTRSRRARVHSPPH